MKTFSQAMDRRTFIKGVGFAALTVQCLPLLAHGAADDLIIHSGPGLLSHMHELRIPYAVLDSPPLQGVKVESTKALFHSHEIELTREQLVLVNQGGTVTVKASSHVFVIALEHTRRNQ